MKFLYICLASQVYKDGEKGSLPSVQENFINLWGWNEYMGVEEDFRTFYENILIGGVVSLVFSHSM
jgi:hypothetical protein